MPTPPGPWGVGPRIAHEAVRALVPPLEQDRPYGAAIENVCDKLLRSGEFARQVAVSIE